MKDKFDEGLVEDTKDKDKSIEELSEEQTLNEGE